MYRFDSDGHFILLDENVDNLLYTGDNVELLDRFMSDIKQNLEVTVNHNVTQFSGLNVTQSANSIHPSVAKYAKTLTKKFKNAPVNLTTPFCLLRRAVSNRAAPPCRDAPPGRAAPPTEPRRPTESRRPTEPHSPALTAPTATAAFAATAATAATATMASPTVLTFDAEGRAVEFDEWVDDLQLVLQCDSRDGVSLFDHTSGVSTTPAATADSTVHSQWTTSDAVARLAVRSPWPPAERTHFGQYKTAQSLYDALVACYSSPATAALSRLMLPYLFPDLAAFATVADLTAHLRTSDARYRAALPTEFWTTFSPFAPPSSLSTY
ncbi:unnamed protein product [Closterium sp. NIES-53]